MNQSEQAIIRHELSPNDGAIVAAIRAQVAPMKGNMVGPEARAMFDQIMEQTPEAAGVTYENGVAGGVPGIWCRPKSAHPGNVILYLHGGAYVMGSVGAYRKFVGQIAARTNTTVFAADYRLAPEHVFPAAVDDAQAAYRGLVEQGDQRIIVAGDSAGGGLALVLLSLAQANSAAGNGLAPSAGIILSPWTDLAVTGQSVQNRADEELFLTRDVLDASRKLYLRTRDATDPLASPLYGKLKGLPPIQLHVGTSEILLDDSLRYAVSARAQGVDATAHVWEGMAHVFPASVGTFDAADQALSIMAQFMHDKLHAK